MEPFYREDYEDLVDKCKNLVLANKVIFATILVLLVLVPLAIHVHYVDLVSPVLTNAEFRSGRHGDISAFYPFLFLMIGTVVLFICFLFKLNNDYPLAKTKFNWWVLALLIMIPFAALFAWSKSTALFGFYENREGVLVYCSYFFVFFLILHQTWFPKQLLKMWFSLIPFLMVNFALGICFVLDIDVLKYPIIYRFLGSNGPFPGGSFLRSTVYNPNFMSGIAGVFYVLFLVVLLMHKKKSVKMGAFVSALVSFILVCTSTSFSGFLLVFGFSPVLLIFAIVKQKQIWKRTLAYFLILVMLMTLCYIPLALKKEQIWNESFGNFIRIASILKGEEAKPVKPPSKDVILPELPEKGVSALSGRSYIWRKSLEVWKKSPVFGTGLETLPFYIDEDDINKVANLGGYHLVIGKPHSLYIGWLYGGGIVTFVALFGFFATLGIGLLIRIWKGTNNVVLLATGFAMVAYLVQGVVNDSRIASSIFFWVITGVFASELVAEMRMGKSKLPQLTEKEMIESVER